jgi:acyl-CoA ligase (AMP-forming) (exosortase A-associated)
MTRLLFELPLRTAARIPAAPALRHAGRTTEYGALAAEIERVASGLLGLGLGKLDRVAVYLPKQPQAVVAFFAATRAGCVFVPVNPLLRPEQVAHILRDCDCRVLVTTGSRARELAPEISASPSLGHVVLVDEAAAPLTGAPAVAVHAWADLPAGAAPPHRLIDTDIASILYTSGSTGKPKGVVLSHRNMVTGADSVSTYLENRADDVLLAVLPFSFDYGFSQLSTAFTVGARVVLMEYLFPKDVITMAAREGATGLAGVPPLWLQLADLEWPDAVRDSLRYITNSGGAMPVATLKKLRAQLPQTAPFLMYGLTEAFRSTFLPPSEVDRRPESIGKAIPNAEILVLRPDGTPCAPNEPGELVHRGSLVALGYWNDPAKTAERFKPIPPRQPGLVIPELAVWSGDTVRADEDGYLYFVGRRDEMIKTSGYRVSPTEVEEIVYATGLVSDAVAVGVPHPTLGQAIVLVAAPAAERTPDSDTLLAACKKSLPLYMMPVHVAWRDSLPRNPNGKFDRPKLAAEFKSLFAGSAT